MSPFFGLESRVETNLTNKRRNIMHMKLFICAIALCLIGITASAEALIIRDYCNNTSGDGQGNSCPPGDYVLLRSKTALGFCGDWICCPANGDGTYNCEKATNPTKSAISKALKDFLGPRTSVLDPGRTPGTKNQQTFSGKNAGVFGRGVEGGEPGAPAQADPGSAK
jgi:hypothetical protein